MHLKGQQGQTENFVLSCIRLVIFCWEGAQRLLAIIPRNRCATPELSINTTYMMDTSFQITFNILLSITKYASGICG